MPSIIGATTGQGLSVQDCLQHGQCCLPHGGHHQNNIGGWEVEETINLEPQLEQSINLSIPVKLLTDP